MKANQSNPPAKGRTTSKVPPKTKGSPNLKATPAANAQPAAKAAPSRKKRPVKILTQDTSTPEDHATPHPAHSDEEVALRAYHNFQKRGSAGGNPTDDWLRAESELTAERRLVRA